MIAFAKGTEVIAVGETYQGSLLVVFAHFLWFLEGKFFQKSLLKFGWSERFQPVKVVKVIEHVKKPNQSDNSKYHCLHTQGDVAFQTLGLSGLTLYSFY